MGSIVYVHARELMIQAERVKSNLYKLSSRALSEPS
jgi:hypothetical protein